MQEFSYTRLSSEYLLILLQGNYHGLNNASCHYFTKGLHDNYQAVAVIWVMANRPWNAEWIGHQLLQDEFWKRRLSVLRGMAVIN